MPESFVGPSARNDFNLIGAARSCSEAQADRHAEEAGAARAAKEARAAEEAANAAGAQAEEEELTALEAEVRTLGHVPRGEQPATDSGVATSVPDGTAPADATQEEEQAAAESEAGETFQGGVGKEWTAEEEEELNLLLAENLAEAGSLAKRARLT